MKPKIIQVGPTGEETIVATFSADIEAFQAAALFQAIIGEDSMYKYYVEMRHKGQTRRVQPDPLRFTINNIQTLRQSIYPCFHRS